MSKHLALLAPVSDLLLVAGRGFHLVEAPLVLDNRIYRDFYQEEAAQGAYIVCDNGAWLTGSSVRDDDLLTAVRAVQAAEVVVPDVFEEPAETLLRAQDFLSICPHMPIMLVPQGKTYKNWALCLRELAYLARGWKEPVFFALPKHLDKNIPGGRSAVVDFLKNTAPGPRMFHLLGGGDDPLHDLDLLQKSSHIRSMDTSEPFASAQQGIAIEDRGSRIRTRKPLNHLAPTSELTEHNLRTYLGWMHERDIS